jgi:hypothetical protein
MQIGKLTVVVYTELSWWTVLKMKFLGVDMGRVKSSLIGGSYE